jgi:hypothetical protein
MWRFRLSELAAAVLSTPKPEFTSSVTYSNTLINKVRGAID